MYDFELLLFDRIEIIRDLNLRYNFEKCSYISFSGGKDSVLLHYLIDLALPNNNIPRVFINTGIEFIDIVKFVNELAINDSRFIIIQPSQNIKFILNEYGFPFKSKQHSHNLSIYWNNRKNEYLPLTVLRYLDIVKSNSLYKCPDILKYQFTKDFNLKCSDKCCLKLKKEPILKWAKYNNRTLAITGMRKDEGGQRLALQSCIILDKDNNIVKFHPLLVISNEFENWFFNKYNIKLCKLYYPPFNFKRTGCKGCPFTLDLQEQLTLMETYLPNERLQCEIIWKPVYDEYRRIGYRLDKAEQLLLF